VTVKAALLATAQAAVQQALQNYLSGVDANAPLPINGRVDRAHIIGLIRAAAGVVKLDDSAVLINGAAADLQLPVTVGAYEMAQWTQQVASTFTWATT
jgi:hypothetical protein